MEVGMELKRAWSQDIYLKALRFAAEAHGEQKIPGINLPYIVHPVAVCIEITAVIAIEGVEEPDLAIQCALLHDAVEDTHISPHAIEMIFGAETASGVMALTKNRDLPKEIRTKDSLERILTQPREIAMVKLADRITNLQPPPVNWDDIKIRHYREEAAMILEYLGKSSPLLAERLRYKLAGYGSGSVF